MPLRVRPGAFVSLCRISATSERKLFIDFSSAQPDNVKQRGISLFKFSNSFKVSSHYTTCYLEKKSQYRNISITFHIKYVPIFSSSHILFPNKRQQNCLISDKNWIYFQYRHIFCICTLAEGVSSATKAQTCKILLTIMLRRKEPYVFTSREILNKAVQLSRK